MNTFSTVMPNPKGSLVNVIPTKDNVDYDRIYHYTTAEALDNFIFVNFNRDTYDKNVAKILRQIKDETHGSTFIPAIVVDINTMIVVDGQNRYEAFKKALSEGREVDVRVIYVNVPEDYLDTLIKVLQEGKKWDNRDYFHRAIANNNVACKKIEEWCEKHRELCMDKSGPNRSYAMSFIYGRRVDKEVKDLTLTINKTQLDFSEQIYKEVLGMFKAMRYKRQNFLEGMTQAWYALRKDKNSTANFFINEMGMDFVYGNIYYEMENYQPNTKKTDWDYKFGQIVQNLYRKFMEKKRAA